MIFSTTENDFLENIKESPYPLGYEGALMHVYENECNYNAIMKAVGLSEMSYYQETGRELFLNEAGAFSGFIDKVKAFFRKVIEKIKSIFKKFIAAIDQYRLDNKQFVKKYSAQILRKDLSNFEFEGYKFSMLDKEADKFAGKAQEIQKLIEGMEDAHDKIAQGYTGHDVKNNPQFTFKTKYKDLTTGERAILKHIYHATDDTFSSEDKYNSFIQNLTQKNNKPVHDSPYSQYYAASDNKVSDLPINIDGIIFSESMTSDEKTKAHEQIRGKLIGDSKALDSDEYRDRLKELFYGDGKSSDKETLDDKDINMRDQLNYIDDSKTTIRKVEKNQKDITKHIENALKKLDKLPKELSDTFKTDGYNGVAKAEQQNLINLINNILDGARSASNDITIGFGTLVQAYKDRVTQAKAMCVKVLSHKESAMYESVYNNDYDSNDIFNNINII